MELLLGFIIGVSLLIYTRLGRVFMGLISPNFIREIFKKHGLPDDIKADEVASDIDKEVKAHCEPVFKRSDDEYFDEERKAYKKYDEIAWIFDREQIEHDSYEILLKKVIETYRRPVGDFNGAFDTREDRGRAFEEIIHRSEQFIRKENDKGEDII